jgi:mRNA-degrading endonuclease RelE of RelBE toxin-antitoxin system
LWGIRHWRIIDMRFIETPVFTAAIRRHLGDEQYRQLQIALMLRPHRGPVIPASGGLRKVRWATTGGGKRGGLRVVYYWSPNEQVVYMLYAYAKSAQGDLTRAQIRQLGRLVREELE